jgi:hypothetical protein
LIDTVEYPVLPMDFLEEINVELLDDNESKISAMVDLP